MHRTNIIMYIYSCISVYFCVGWLKSNWTSLRLRSLKKAFGLIFWYSCSCHIFPNTVIHTNSFGPLGAQAKGPWMIWTNSQNKRSGHQPSFMTRRMGCQQLGMGEPHQHEGGWDVAAPTEIGKKSMDGLIWLGNEIWVKEVSLVSMHL